MVKLARRRQLQWHTRVVGALSCLLVVGACSTTPQLSSSKAESVTELNMSTTDTRTSGAVFGHDERGPHMVRPDGTYTDVKTPFTELPDAWPADIPQPGVRDIDGTKSELFHILGFRAFGTATHSAKGVEVFDHYTAQLLDAGFEPLYEDRTPGFITGLFERSTGQVLPDGTITPELVDVSVFEVENNGERSALLDIMVHTYVVERDEIPAEIPTLDDQTKASL